MTADRILIFAPYAPFVQPYLEREFADHDFTCNLTDKFNKAVMISSTDVYNVASGNLYDETTGIISGHPMVGQEQAFIRACDNAGVEPTILRCPNIIATRMTGFPRDMVNRIYRGSYFHIKGVDEHLSVVHASDIAAAARLTVGNRIVLNVTDGCHPTFHDLAEALAYRLGQKRIFTISERWARFRYNASLYNTLTNTLTFSSQKIRDEFGFVPTSVCLYLTTHIYDETSL